jgi:hypothetical protein
MHVKNKYFRLFLLLLALVVLGGSIFFFLNKKEPEPVKTFPLENNVLIGNKIGTISLIDVSNRKIVDSLSLQDDDLLFETSESSENNLDNIVDEESEDMQDNQEISNNESEEQFLNEKEIPEETLEVLSRDISIIGEAYGYKLVKIPIVKGDYWLKLQKLFLPDKTEYQLLLMGREVNSEKLHPIYPYNQRLFLVPNDLLKKEEPKEEVPKEAKAKEDNKETEEVKAKEFLKEFKYDNENSYENYVYEFSDENFIFDNINSTLYKVEINNNSLNLVKKYSIENVKVKRFKVENGILVFTNKEDSNIYISNGSKIYNLDIKSYLSDWDIHNDMLLYAVGEDFHSFNLETGEKNSLHLGDLTTDIHLEDSYIYIANKFGSTISKSVIHKIDYDLKSYGWAEIGYSADTKIIGINNKNEILAKQNLQDNKEKIVLVDNKLSLSLEVALEKTHKEINVLDEDRLYGVDKGILYLYDIQGRYINSINLQAEEIRIIK